VPLEGGLFGQMRRTGQPKDVILKNKAGKLLKIKDRGQKTKRNKPKNKAEKLFKTLDG
jgi:hypothetical protein